MTRILIIEDEPTREMRLKSWLPPDVRSVVASSAGKAIGILRRDSGVTYAGLVLDFDPQLRRATASDLHLSGHDVVLAIIQYVSPEVRILVHSKNTSQSSVMVQALQHAGFSVTQIPMHLLTADLFGSFFEGLRGNQCE